MRIKSILLCLFVIISIISFTQQPKTESKQKSKHKDKTATVKPKPSAQAKPVTQVKPKQLPSKTANYIDSILISNKEAFSTILNNPKMHHVQIIYTQINRDKNNRATFINYNYRLNKSEFFYPASMVKLPASVLALEKVEELNKTGINIYSRMLTDKAYACQTTTFTDSGSADGYPSIAQYIKRMMLVSDNTAYSRIYEFLTPEYIYRKLYVKGYPTARIRIRFDVECLGKPNNYSNPIRFLNDSGRLLYTQPQKYFAANQLLMPVNNTIKLIDFKNNGGNFKKDFSHSNFICLQDMHEILKSIMFPKETPPNKAFKIKPESRKFLWKYMQMLPYESDFPRYANRSHYIDSYKKYLFYGQDSNIIENTNIRIFNVVGESYGYTTDCAYFVDFENKIEFMLSATYFVQEPNGAIDASNECYNKYKMPFFRNLGQSVYLYELKRTRKYFPDLLEFKF